MHSKFVTSKLTLRMTMQLSDECTHAIVNPTAESANSSDDVGKFQVFNRHRVAS